MFNIYRQEMQWQGKTLSLETGKMARQADGAVVARMGETVVLCTVVAARKAKPGADFFPLTVNYQEKTFAAGKIPGSFFKREGRPSEPETLISRLIDRPVRPLFPEGYFNEVQVIATVISHDLEHPSDIVAMIGCSAALTISGVPFMGPIGAARVGYINGEYVLNPTLDQIKQSKLDLVVAGTKEGVLMVESEAQELTEDVMLGAVTYGHQHFQPVIDLIIKLAEMAAKEPHDLAPWPYDRKALQQKLQALIGADVAAAYKEVVKQTRYSMLDKAQEKALAAIPSEEFGEQAVMTEIEQLKYDHVRNMILDSGRRIDGRTTKDIRPIVAEVGVLPRPHGTALFTRGETQALVCTTLGTGDDEQLMDVLEGTYHEHFMLHYNFPPYSVGETGRMGSPGRREIGHGKLAWRAIHPLMPSKEDFPYTVRVVSEITESNGSSSMATVCGTSLALMDAGVPLARPIAGIAMGLIKEQKGFAVLSDILGDEDHLGDMDFKVAGTEYGVTSLQMDLKIASITPQIMKIALDQAKDGRMHILGEMAKAISKTRSSVSQHAPRIHTFSIPKDKIREVIGSGGKVIKEIVEKTGAKIDIADDGTIKVAGTSGKTINAAVEWIQGIVAEPEIGTIYTGKVVKIMDFGAFVNFMGSRDGLVHISEIADRRIAKVTDVLAEGQMVKVKVLDIDNRGKVKLSMKVVDQATGEDISGRTRQPHAPSDMAV
ncbi:MAG: polyribonucleotide nucleotidyltransferase [Alphaproteobacteria bacterium]|nr:polyribonucleotide nucleotidyltransferase [Alphaproteobacteria bacterium]